MLCQFSAATKIPDSPNNGHQDTHTHTHTIISLCVCLCAIYEFAAAPNERNNKKINKKCRQTSKWKGEALPADPPLPLFLLLLPFPLRFPVLLKVFFLAGRGNFLSTMEIIWSAELCAVLWGGSPGTVQTPQTKSRNILAGKRARRLSPFYFSVGRFWAIRTNQARLPTQKQIQIR